MNNHVDSNEMLIVLGLIRAHGGTGPTLFSYDKIYRGNNQSRAAVSRGNHLSGYTTSGWYFSATRPTTLYISDGSKMLRYDVLSHASEVVFDVAGQFGADRDIWQMSSSNDDLVHAATLRVRVARTTWGAWSIWNLPVSFSTTRKRRSMNARSIEVDAF